LALEDVLHQPRSGLLSKVDYYSKHLFLRILSHQLAKGEDHEHDPILYANPVMNHSYPNLDNTVTGLPRSASPMHTEFGEDEDDERAAYNSQRRTWRGKSSAGSMRSRKQTFADVESANQKLEGLPHLPRSKSTAPAAHEQPRPRQDSAHRNQMRNAQAIEELKKGQRVDVKIEPLCIFLCRDGTVISINRTPDLAFTQPIRERLKHRDTGLRNTADPSLLVHALLDLLVDRTLEVVDEYHTRIVALEHDVLVHPKMNVVRDLHIIQGDLILHKRTLEPIKTVVYGLRRYDVDRCAALLPDEERDPSKPVKGYMSHKAKIYLVRHVSCLS
jgi:Mg2+ and Co2+ transporter CorA